MGTGPGDDANPFLAERVDFAAGVGDGHGVGCDARVDGLPTGDAGRDDVLGGDGTVAVVHEPADPEGHSLLLFYNHLSRGPNPSGVGVDDGQRDLSRGQVIH